MTDLFTNYVEVVAVPNQLAEDCACRILNDFISRVGAPLPIHTDQGRTFESRLFQDLCKMLEIRKTRTSPRNPKCNGQTERYNRTLLKMKKAYIVGEQDEWDLYLGCLAGAYRCTPCESTKITPYLLSLGREIRLPADLVYGFASNPREEPECATYIAKLRDKMMHAHNIARLYLKSSAKRSKMIYDTKTSYHEYKAGDVVWYLHETKKLGVTPKLD
jgi:transposase InsO family protein